VIVDLPLLRNSERANFKECPAKWNWGWNFGLQSIVEQRSAAWFGSILHLAMAEWYGPKGAKDGFVRGRDPRETVEEAFKGEYAKISAGPYFDEVAEKEYWDAAELGKIMMGAYLDKYGEDPSWEVLLPETRFSVKIPFTSEQIIKKLDFKLNNVPGDSMGKFITRLVGTFDMPIRDHTDGHVKIVDHKSTNKKENPVWLQKDDQTGTYIAVATGFLRKAGFIAENEAVVGAIWNYLRKGKPDERPTNELGQACNKPTKAHYVAQLSAKMMGVTETELKKETLPVLEAIAEKAKIEVLGDVSLQQPNPLFWRIDLRRNKHNRLRQVQRISEDAELIAKTRSGELPVLKTPGEHCGWCQFKELCDVDEDGGDTDQFIKDVFRTVDMYADHRKGAKNSKESVAARKETGVK
jgi:hypothetical protein